MTPGTPLQLSLTVIRPVFVQSWVNGSNWAVLFAATGTVATTLSANAAMSAGTVCRWRRNIDYLGQDAISPLTLGERTGPAYRTDVP